MYNRTIAFPPTHFVSLALDIRDVQRRRHDGHFARMWHVMTSSSSPSITSPLLSVAVAPAEEQNNRHGLNERWRERWTEGGWEVGRNADAGSASFHRSLHPPNNRRRCAMKLRFHPQSSITTTDHEQCARAHT